MLCVLCVAGGLIFKEQGRNFMANVFSELSAKNATIKTNLGEIEIEFFAKKSPNIVKNFVSLSKAKKYDNTIFHRVIEGFMIQGGDFENNDGTGGEAFLGGEIDDEIVPELSHIRGIVSMANHGRNTNGSQFFIVQKDATFLDGKYSIFGKVTKGMEVVDAIASVKRDDNDRPLSPVTISTIVVR